MKAITLLISLAFIVGSCGFGDTAKTAEPTADKFYKLLEKRDYDAIVKLIDLKGTGTNAQDWVDVLVKREVLGEQKKVKKNMGFNTQYKNGVTTVELTYSCELENGTTSEKIILVERGEVFKIFGYEFNQDV